MSNYQKYRKKLLDLKKQIDNEYNEGKPWDIDRKFSLLNNIYRKAISYAFSEEDKFFIEFNYHSAKTLLCIEKGSRFQVYIEFLKALKYFNLFYNTGKNEKAGINGLKYYESRKEHLIKNQALYIDIFKDRKDKILGIINLIEEILKHATDSYSNISIQVIKIVVDLLRFIVLRSGEIYNEEDFEIKQNIINIVNSYINEEKLEKLEPIIIAYKYIILFYLLKKELFYNIRKLVPKEKGYNFVRFSEIEYLIEQLKKYANMEEKFLKKVKANDLNEKGKEKYEYIKFLANLDKEMSDYYKFLFVHRNFIKAIKKLNNIFDYVKNNIHIIFTDKIIKYLFQEYIFLKTYLKILILSNELKRVITSNNLLMDWQQDIFMNIKNYVDELLNKYFKYEYGNRDINKELLIVDIGMDGMLIEFIIFYLLRELVLQNIDFEKEITAYKKRSENFSKLLEILKNTPSFSNIKWGREVNNSDIDIFTQTSMGDVAIFIKIGNVKGKINKIYNEIDNARSLGCKFIFYVLDFVKNIDIINKLTKEEFKDIVLLDVKETLDCLLEIAKGYNNIDIRLKKDSIYTYAGFIFK